MYAKYIKRIIDFMLSLCAIIVLSPLFLILTIIGAIKMKGNPFFSQERPGRHEKIFKLVKFRTMSNEKDVAGNFLPDTQRLNTYGKFLRSTSLDELPEIFNIIKGDMSIIGPRPLLIEYLPWYTEFEKRRHDVRPGLTGLAQINGRNSVGWEKRFQFDVEYVNNISFALDVEIFLRTISKVINRSDVSDNTSATEGNLAEIRRKKYKGVK
jgi:lipopolysaccharide/colanic/teichoic acid biosynthesis glycosyltransferase